MWILLMLIMTVAAPADATIEQAFRQNGALGVVSLAKAIEKDEGAAKAVELMSLVLQHEDAELGAAAAHAVGILGDAGKMALPQLATALIGDQAAVISKALNTLGPGDIPIWLAEATLRPNGDTKAYQALVALGLTDERLVPILQEGLGHSDLRVRRYAVVLLAKLGAKAAPARGALARLLEQEPSSETTPDSFLSPSDVRAEAAYALGSISAEPDETVRLLLVMLKHSDPKIRIGSAVGLAKMGEKSQAAIPALIEQLAAEDLTLQPAFCIFSMRPNHAAAVALVGIGPMSIPALIEALRADQPRVRRHAADALWFFGTEAKPAVEPLFERLHDPDVEVRCKAIHALGWIAPEAEKLVSELVRLTHDEHAEVRSQAVNTLSYLEPSDRVALDDFIRLLDDPDPVVVETALDGLQRLAPNAKAISAIARLLKSPDDMVREAAIRTLVGIGHEAKSTIPALSKLLNDDEPYIRRTAVEALGQMGPDAESAVPAITKLLKDENPEVRQAADLALEMITEEL